MLNFRFLAGIVLGAVVAALSFVFRFPGSKGIVGAIGSFLFFTTFYTFMRRLTIRLTASIPKTSSWRSRTVPVLALLGAVFAVFSDPIWRLALGGEKELLVLAGISCAALCLLRALAVTYYAYLGFFLIGFLAVHSPITLFLALGFVSLRWFYSRDYEFCDYGSWRAFVCFLVGGAIGYYLFMPDGIEYLRSSLVAAKPIGWLFFGIFSLGSALITLTVLPRLTFEGRGLQFFLGVLSLVSGVLAYTQLSPIGSMHYWCLDFSLETVSSPLLLAFGAALSAIALTMCAALFASYAFHLMPRSYSPWKLLAGILFGTLMILMLGLPKSILRTDSRQLRELFYEAAEEIAEEVKGAKYLFSDGVLDEELKAILKCRGEELAILPLVEEGEKLNAKKLSDWVVDSAAELEESAVQFGFDLWQRERKALPTASGLVARSGGLSAEEIERGSNKAKEIGLKLKALFDSGAVLEDGDKKVREKASSVMWRIARIARLREEFELADELEEANLVLQHIIGKAKRERDIVMNFLTDEEKLQFALKRADFKSARSSATAILRRHPKSASANFALGMYHLMENRLDAAKPYLEAALEANPEEPAFLNNLAILHLKKGELERAKELSDKATRLAPSIPAINEANMRIREALENARRDRF